MSLLIYVVLQRISTDSGMNSLASLDVPKQKAPQCGAFRMVRKPHWTS